MSQIKLYDTTLRDGAQTEGVSFSISDKIAIAQKLDDLGVGYIEAGWPGANPKDNEVFAALKNIEFKNAKLVAFGSTRRAAVKASQDAVLQAMIESGAPVVTLVGKGSHAQVTRVLEIDPEENINMVQDSISYLKSLGREVFLDAEHFFDGYKDNAAYSMRVLAAAQQAGADGVVLCDTNGGALPEEIYQATRAVVSAINIAVGIHCHNDSDCAVANTLAAVNAGATQVQGTVNGLGERCGNANLCAVIPALKLKMTYNDVVNDEQLRHLREISLFVAERANMALPNNMAYVGSSAFSHKAGLHVSGLRRWSGSYQHIEPDLVGNKMRTLVSDQSGRANILQKAEEMGIDLTGSGKEIKNILQIVKDMESRGFQYENAEASFELLLQKGEVGFKAPFELIDYMVVVEKRRRFSTKNNGDVADLVAEAMVKLKVNDEILHTVSEGDGPVNALDNALRKALNSVYPQVANVKLTDYKVRLIGESSSTGSLTRVLIESSNGKHNWHTVGAGENIIDASWIALADSMEYFLINKDKLIK
ncbi:MAG: citramalate synthase [Chloroflexi bacterium]|nr:citramalate synthase [Chloroflexota bacterium]